MLPRPNQILRHRQANERVGREEEAREKSPRRSQSLESCGNPALAIYLASSINSTNGAATRRKGTPIISSREGARSPPAPEARQGTSHERVATGESREGTERSRVPVSAARDRVSSRVNGPSLSVSIEMHYFNGSAGSY